MFLSKEKKNFDLVKEAFKLVGEDFRTMESNIKLKEDEFNIKIAKLDALIEANNHGLFTQAVKLDALYKDLDKEFIREVTSREEVKLSNVVVSAKVKRSRAVSKKKSKRSKKRN